MTGSAKIELSKSHDDWPAIRECFIHSFRRYPLYKYMVPEDNKRDDFLRAYLDANYDVTVGTGRGILLAITGLNEEGKTRQIGGVLFVPPAGDGCGWAIGSDEPYWEAYEKHGLAKISKEGLERVKRYEAWESKHVTRKVTSAKLPMWNGLFCAIVPEYSSRGFGSMVYREAIRIMARHWKDSLGKSPCRGRTETSGFLGLLSSKLLHGFSLLNHRQMPTAVSMAPGTARTDRQATEQSAGKSQILHNPTAPLVAAISHSDRSASFHASNGFHPVTRVPYVDPVTGETPFYAHVLVLDPFKTGRLPEFDAALVGEVNCNVITTQKAAPKTGKRDIASPKQDVLH